VSDAERQDQVRRLVRAALELQPIERSAFWAALSDDAPLREEVEALISSYEKDEAACWEKNTRIRCTR
jgi:hypothetical protein